MKILRTVIAVLISSAMLAVSVSAEGAPQLSGYYVGEETIHLFCSDFSEPDAECIISGEQAAVEYVGNVYNDADMYKTIFLIDTSASMKNYSASISDIIKGCIDAKQANEYISIAEFGATYTPSYLTDFTNDRYQLEKSIDSVAYDDKASYIYDNLNSAINDISVLNESCFKRIIIFTDGCENSAKGITIDDVIGNIQKMGIQIYTVTFVDNNKNNFEQLKTVARLAREGGGSDMRIEFGGSPDPAVKTISSSVKDIYAYKVTVPASVADGSKKALQLKSASGTVMGDVRMPMIVAQETTTTAAPIETRPVITTSIIKPETVSEPPEPKKESPNLIFILVGVGAVLIFGAAIAILLINSKPKPKPKPSPNPNDIFEQTDIIGQNSDTESHTEILTPGTEKPTDILLHDDVPTVPVITFKDVASSNVRTATLDKELIVGRSSSQANVVIDYDMSVHRRHCRIFLKNGEVYVADLGGANKTYLNDREVSGEGTRLKTSDVLKLGRVKLQVTIK